MHQAITGKWSYRSFRHDPIVVKDGRVVGKPDLATPWSPPDGVLEVSTGEMGEVMGTLTFSPKAVLKISGRIIPATDKCPAGVELIGAVGSSVNRIKGFFIPGSDHIVGTILCEANDPGQQPNGTLGPFVLFPIKA